MGCLVQEFEIISDIKTQFRLLSTNSRLFSSISILKKEQQQGLIMLPALLVKLKPDDFYICYQFCWVFFF